MAFLVFEENFTPQELDAREALCRELNQAFRQAFAQLALPELPLLETVDFAKEIATELKALCQEYQNTLKTLYSDFSDQKKYIERPALQLLQGQNSTAQQAGLPDVWLLGWRARTACENTDIHDHLNTAGAVHVLEGRIQEIVFHVPPKQWRSQIDLSVQNWHEQGLSLPAHREERIHHQGQIQCLGIPYIHDVKALPDPECAVSIHAYYPPLECMTYYAYQDDCLIKKEALWREN